MNLFWHDSKSWTFFPVWLTDLNFFFFLKTTHRIEPFFFFFFEDDSQNWTLFLWIWPKNWTLISWIWRKELNRLIFEYDSKNWTFFFLSWLKELNSFLHMTQRITHWIDFQFFFFKKDHDSKKRTFFFDITQRIEPFKKQSYDSKNCIFFLVLTLRIDFFSVQLTELNPFFFEYDQRIGLFFLEDDAKNWTLDFLNMTQRIEPLNFWIWLTELDLLFKYDAKNWVFFFEKTLKELKVLNPSWISLKGLNLFF